MCRVRGYSRNRGDCSSSSGGLVGQTGSVVIGGNGGGRGE